MKAILIIDIPNGCYDCPCYYEDRNQCEATLQNVKNADILKPSWCPLKLLPQKKSIELACQKEDEGNDYGAGLIVGWNDCLKEITE